MSDPRYDPRFQRGWNGEAAPVPAPLDAVPAADPEPGPPAHGRASARQRGEPPAAVAPEADPEAAAEATPTSAGPDGDAEPRIVRNPFRVALLALGVVLVVVATGLLWQLALPVPSSSDAGDYALPQLELEIAPSLALGGLVSIIAAIAVGAVRRR